jgi:hypothetical protein
MVGYSGLGSSIAQSTKNMSGLGTLVIGSPLKGVTAATSKERSILMKSVYETNLFKEQFLTMGNSGLQQKRGSLNVSSGPFNNT